MKPGSGQPAPAAPSRSEIFTSNGWAGGREAALPSQNLRTTRQKMESTPFPSLSPRLPNEVVIEILHPRRGAREGLREYWIRLAEIASIGKLFANLVHDLRYKAVSVKLGGNLRPKDHPAAKHIRHLKRCRKALNATRFLEIDGIVEWAPRKNSVYQQISIEQITRAAEYARHCPHVQILNTEILDPSGERGSDRRAIMAREVDHAREIADSEILEFGEWRSVGIETEDEEESRKDEKQKREEKEDKEDGEELPPPKTLPAIQSLVIENTYHTTPNAITAIISLVPNLVSLTLDGIHWQPNQWSDALPDAPCHQIKHLACLDITYDPVDDANFETDNEMNPTFPLLLHTETMRHLHTLHLGYRDRSWRNDSDILSWSRIDLRGLEQLRSIRLSTTIEIREVGDTIRFFFGAASDLIRNASGSLREINITLLPGASEDENAIHNVQARHWRRLRDAIPPQVTSLLITFAVPPLLPLPADREHEAAIRKALSGGRANMPRIRFIYMTRREWIRKRAVTTAETHRVKV